MTRRSDGDRIQLSLAFDPRRPDNVRDPAATLGDLLGLVGDLGVDAIVMTQRMHEARIHLDLEFRFSAPAPDRLNLIERAVIRAEGQAGFVATVGDPSLLPVADWDGCTLHLDRPEVRGLSFSLPLPLEGVQDRLYRRLHLTDAGYGYRIACHRVGPDAALARALVRPLVEVEGIGATGAALAGSLRHAVELLRQAGWYAVEAICLRNDAAAAVGDAVEAALLDWAHHLHPALPRDLAFTSWRPLAELAAMTPETPLADPVERRRADAFPLTAIASAANAATREAWHAPLPPTAPAPGGPPMPPSPPPPEDGRFAFISYAHRETDWARRVIDVLATEGVRVWFDAGIDGGALWDEVLERRIREAALVIACVSTAYEASRYCRREIKFADLLGKPILPIAQGAHVWGEGLAMMFQERQILQLAEQQIARLAREVERMAPQCLDVMH